MTSTPPPPPWLLTASHLWTFPITQPFFGAHRPDLAPGTFAEGNDLSSEDGKAKEAVERAKTEFVGGLGMLMVLRYREGPFGPYDELVLIPGEFNSPTSTGRGIRITSIWVSTQAAMEAGRHHLLIPKNLAVFTFSPSPLSASQYSPISVTISLPSTPSKPFFSATLSPSRLLPPFFTLPLRTIFSRGRLLEGWSPLRDFVQPPLVDDASSKGEWLTFRGKIVGGFKGCWAEGTLPEEEEEEGARVEAKTGNKWGGRRKALGDGRSVSRGDEVWRFGLYGEEVTLIFGVGTKLGVGEG